MNVLNDGNKQLDCEQVDEADAIESDSDLFGEGGDVLSDSSAHSLVRNECFRTEATNSEKCSGSVSNEKEYMNDSSNFENIKFIDIKPSTNIPIFGDSERTFLTLKLPKRLKINFNQKNYNDAEFNDDVNIVGYIDDNGSVKSNTKLVSWSDGSYSLLVNGKLSYDCILGIENAMLFDNRSDSNYKLSISRIDQKFTVRPATVEKRSTIRESKPRIMMPTTLEDINQAEIETRRRNEELNALKYMKIEQKNNASKYCSNKRQMTSTFLENSSEEDI